MIPRKISPIMSEDETRKLYESLGELRTKELIDLRWRGDKYRERYFATIYGHAAGQYARKVYEEWLSVWTSGSGKGTEK